MTTSKKTEVNWFYLILGIFFSSAILGTGKKIVQEKELEAITIVVNHDIQEITGRRSENKFRLVAKEYECSFVIKTAGGIAAAWDNLADITKNDTLIIKISKSRHSDLTKKSGDIPIYSLVKNGKEIYDIQGYNAAQKKLNQRWNVIFMIMGTLLILRGLTIISSKTAYIVGAISAAIIITLRILNIGW